MTSRKRYRLLASSFFHITCVHRVVLGRSVHTSNTRRGHHGWRRAEKFSKFVPPDTLKMHSLAHSVLRFICKRFSKILKLTLQKTIFRGWFIKIHIFKQNVCMAMSLWLVRGAKRSELKDETSSTEGITRSSANGLR